MISVIIPVYNSDKYLHVCLNSILKQTYLNFEIICIDDGSSDYSLEILDFFSKKDSRIHIIKNNYNKGLDFCLKKGLEVSNGKYIYFLRPEDWLSFNTFELLIKTIETDSSDAVLFKNSFYDEINHSFLFKDENFVISHNIFNHHDLEKESLFKIELGLYNCFYLKSFLRKLYLNFSDENKSFMYDELFYKTILYANKISIINKNLAIIREFFTSDSKVDNYILSNEITRKFNIFRKFLENKKIYAYYKKYLFDFCLNSCLNKVFDNSEKNLSQQINLFFQELILKYGLYNDIKTNLNYDLFNNYHIEELYSDLMSTYPLVSVIIPVYNVEKYITKCLNSVCNQSFKNFEIICINDGSTDESKYILEYYSNNDLRISIVNQKNRGPGFARNVGMKHAKGDYILFVDSDDFIDLNSIEYCYDNLISNGSDIAIFKFSRFSDENINYSQTGFPLDDLFGNIDYNRFTFTFEDIKNYVLNSSFAVWSKIYKKEFLENFDSDFPVGLVYEDILFHVKSLLNASSISFIPKFLYNYRISNVNSIMANELNCWDIFEIVDYVEEYLKQNDFFNHFKFEFLLFKVTQLSQYINKLNSEEFFVAVKNEFECILNKTDYCEDDFKQLPEKFKNIFFNVISSKDYSEFEEGHEPTIF